MSVVVINGKLIRVGIPYCERLERFPYATRLRYLGHSRKHMTVCPYLEYQVRVLAASQLLLGHCMVGSNISSGGAKNGVAGGVAAC